MFSMEILFSNFRSLGLQLASFETKEKADSITTYLTNAGKFHDTYFFVYIVQLALQIRGTLT